MLQKYEGSRLRGGKMDSEEKKIFRQSLSKHVHDIRGSLTIIQLFLSSWNNKLPPEIAEDHPILLKEVDKMKILLNSLSEDYKSRLT